MRSLIFDADIPMANAVARGAMCLSCGAEFEEPEGEASACSTCWNMMEPEDRAATRRARSEEKNKAAWAKRGRARKASKWAGLKIGTERA